MRPEPKRSQLVYFSRPKQIWRITLSLKGWTWSVLCNLQNSNGYLTITSFGLLKGQLTAILQLDKYLYILIYCHDLYFKVEMWQLVDKVIFSSRHVPTDSRPTPANDRTQAGPPPARLHPDPARPRRACGLRRQQRWALREELLREGRKGQRVYWGELEKNPPIKSSSKAPTKRKECSSKHPTTAKLKPKERIY